MKKNEVPSYKKVLYSHLHRNFSLMMARIAVKVRLSSGIIERRAKVNVIIYLYNYVYIEQFDESEICYLCLYDDLRGRKRN